MRMLVLASIFVTPGFALSGCAGPIAYQLATSIVTRGIDKIANNAYEAKLRDEKLAAERSHTLKDTGPDPYYLAFATAGFETITPVIEPLPANNGPVADKDLGVATSISSNESVPQTPGNPATSNIKPTNTQSSGNPGSARITQLVRVEIWNLVIGDEKTQILEKARLLGEPLPPRNEWHTWKVATGAAENSKKPITFLIPPDLGPIRSGNNAVVEITAADHLYVARYASN